MVRLHEEYLSNGPFFFTFVIANTESHYFAVFAPISPFFCICFSYIKHGRIKVLNILKTTLDQDNVQNVSEGLLEQLNKNLIY